MKILRNRAVLAFLLFNILAGILFVGGALQEARCGSVGARASPLPWPAEPISSAPCF